eukprot:gnl/TRDRNA2_/TRDRNA2_190381_c0_seq1.p1 gnl/TRDRNA2_/TRDRNA2_190381_c0~~gnl/TRDRNA2_/TRDRNA2_190381_c0_seq1.p1  ORF type:complete len:358 (+),score=77.67 gnl/TRDRNA2_/TRDRNA2_190381_c0_seq1:53-1075(+)
MAGAESSGRRADFERDGFLHIKGFASLEECEGLKSRMQELISAWDPVAEKVPVFVTDEKEQEKAQGSSDYFLDSADRIHFFLEKDATDEDGNPKADVGKARALNKVGHGLHVADEVFKAYSYSDKVCDLVKELGWQDPVLPQSMYIFKQPVIGGEVTSHQDSTFLHTTPRESCLGLWLALHPATTENGCIWARPGSHTEPVRRLFKRNKAHFDGDKSAPQMVFQELDIERKSGASWEWEGKMPSGWEPPRSGGLHDKGFKPVECEVGDLVVIHGQVDHLSLPNTSSKQRETYQLHLIEGPSKGVTWASSNWLQYPSGKVFPSLLKGAVLSRKRKAEHDDA